MEMPGLKHLKMVPDFLKKRWEAEFTKFYNETLDLPLITKLFEKKAI